MGFTGKVGDLCCIGNSAVNYTVLFSIGRKYWCCVYSLPPLLMDSVCDHFATVHMLTAMGGWSICNIVFGSNLHQLWSCYPLQK